MRYLSPLRYPGGKAKLAPYITELINAQTPRPDRYAEPFAGGAGAALQLLYTNTVEHVHLNDLNPGIAAFWRTTINQPGALIKKIHQCELTIDEWKNQREIYTNATEHDDLTLGFATFYLNRTNRSGIIDARPIGGMEQTGKWKIDARFNRTGLAQRITAITALADRITISEKEGIEFLDDLKIFGNNVFVYADPPYLVQGQGLYLHAFNETDHQTLATQLAQAPYPWMLTYDDDPRITKALYQDQRSATFQIAHTAHKQHVGTESIIYSPTLTIPNLTVTKGREATWN